jgi:hypothetical protein
LRFPFSYNANSENRGEALLIVLLLLILLSLSPFLWIVSRLRRQYYLSIHGYWVTRRGRDDIEYQERHNNKVDGIIIGGEMMSIGPHVIYVPSIEGWKKNMPEWAQGRRDEIISRVKEFLSSKNYRYKELP